MNTEPEWNPGHAINDGYPFSHIVSRRTHIDRIGATIHPNNEVQLFIERDKWPAYEELLPDLPEKRTPFEGFLFNRIYDLTQALNQAEGQIEDILREKPFNPQSYGFEVAVKNKKITDQPLKIFVSKFNENVTLYRKPIDLTEDDFKVDLNKWILMRKEINAEGQPHMTSVEINLPCDRIAYAAFYALGVKVKDENLKSEDMKSETKPNRYHVRFEREGRDPIDVLHVPAFDEKEALSSAKFHLETEKENNVEDVKFEELSIVK
jgi:hypothetical protein